MKGSTIRGVRKLGLLGLPLLAIVVAVMVFAWNSSSSEPAQAVGAATGQLEVKNAVGGPCSATKCSVIANSIFTLSVDISAAGAYSGIQTEVTYAGPGIGLYKADTAANEIVWPPSQGVLELRSPAAPTGAEGIVNHAASSAILPPRPAAVFLGNIVEIDINCLVAGTGGTVALVPFDAATNTNASGLDVSDGMPSKVVPISDSMDINCVQAPTATNTPTPTSTPEVPSIGKSPSLQNLFLTRQGAKIPPSTCIGSTNSATLVVGLDSPIANVPDPKDPSQDQELGAYEFEVKYDQAKVCLDLTAGPAAANMICAIEDSVSKPNLEGVARIGCVTLGKNTFPDTSTQAGRILAILTVKPQPDEYSVIKPNQDNGNVTQLLNTGCELADLQGHPISTTGVCADADVTIRYLEGDVEPSCGVDTLDTQAIAFRWGANKGSLLFNDRFNLEPSGAQADQDIDIKDLQFVYGRFGSSCAAPHPPQGPVNPKGGPTPTAPAAPPTPTATKRPPEPTLPQPTQKPVGATATPQTPAPPKSNCFNPTAPPNTTTTCHAQVHLNVLNKGGEARWEDRCNYGVVDYGIQGVNPNQGKPYGGGFALQALWVVHSYDAMGRATQWIEVGFVRGWLNQDIKTHYFARSVLTKKPSYAEFQAPPQSCTEGAFRTYRIEETSLNVWTVYIGGAVVARINMGKNRAQTIQQGLEITHHNNVITTTHPEGFMYKTTGGVWRPWTNLAGQTDAAGNAASQKYRIDHPGPPPIGAWKWDAGQKGIKGKNCNPAADPCP